MKKEIILNADKKRELAMMFKVTYSTVWAALTYKTNSGRAKTLRAAALQRGGVEINTDGGFQPNLFFVSFYNEVPRQFVCDFSERVRLVCELGKESSGDGRIEVDDKVVKTYKKPLMKDVVLMQADAQEIVNDLK